MDYLIPVYIIYASVAIGLVMWLARTLFQHGAVFLEDVFDDNPRLAQTINKLLLTGFYMLNLGYAGLLLKAGPATSVVGSIEVLSVKLGILLVSLALLHFLNMYVLMRVRRRATAAFLPPPVVPQAHLV